MPTPEDSPKRSSLRALTQSIRRLCDAAVSTDIAAERIDAVREEVDRACDQLEAQSHDGPYSGLMRKPPNYQDPHDLLPLSPIIGDFNPVAPDIQLRFEEGRVVGSGTLGKKHIGPPHTAHGGVGALIADQLIALAAVGAGVRGVTRDMQVRYRKPTPLYRELELHGWCEESDDAGALVRAEIRCDGVTTLEAKAQIRVARHLTHPSRRTTVDEARGGKATG